MFNARMSPSDQPISRRAEDRREPFSLQTAVDTVLEPLSACYDRIHDCSRMHRIGEVLNGCKCLWIEAGGKLAGGQLLFSGLVRKRVTELLNCAGNRLPGNSLGSAWGLIWGCTASQAPLPFLNGRLLRGARARSRDILGRSSKSF